MKYTVTMEISVDRSSSILSADTYHHTTDVEEAVRDIMYDLDDVKILNMTVTNTPQR